MLGRCRAARAICWLGAALALGGAAGQGGGVLDPEPFLSLLQVLAKPLRRVGPTDTTEEETTLASLRFDLAQLTGSLADAVSDGIEAAPTHGHDVSLAVSGRHHNSHLDPAPECAFSEPVAVSPLAAGRVQSHAGSTTAEECLAWCLGDGKCLSVVFEPGAGACHALPETYGNHLFRMLSADPQAVVVDKSCPRQCGFSRPRNGKSPKQVLKNLRAGSFTSCKRRCANDRRCLSVVYRKSKRDCWLKKAAYDQNLQFATDDAMCSNKICRRACTFPTPQLLSEFGNQRAGNPRLQSASSLGECQQICAASASCGSAVYDSALATCHAVPEARVAGSPRLVGASNLMVSQKQVAVRCSCATVPSGKCMTGCDPEGPFTHSASGESINQCKCNYDGTDCTVEAEAWACSSCNDTARATCMNVPHGQCMTGCSPHAGSKHANQCECNHNGTQCPSFHLSGCLATPQSCAFTADDIVTHALNEDDATGPSSKTSLASTIAVVNKNRKLEPAGSAPVSAFKVEARRSSIPDSSVSTVLDINSSHTVARKTSDRHSRRTGNPKQSGTMDKASEVAEEIAADAAGVNEALEAAAEMGAISEMDDNSSSAPDASAKATNVFSESAVTSSKFSSDSLSMVSEGQGGLRQERPQVLLGGRAYSAKDTLSMVPDMNFTLHTGQSFSVAFTASWYSLQASSRVLSIFDSGTEGVRLRISNAGSTSTLALVVRREGQEATLKVPEAIAVGVTSRFLCTVAGDDAGSRMQVYRDGKRIGHVRDGLSLGSLPHGRLYLAGGPTQHSDAEHSKKPFEGWLSDVCVWDRQASWEDASACTEKHSRE